MRFVAIARTSLTSILLSPWRSLALLAALVAVLLPYLTGLGISRGIQAAAEDSVRHGADLYVSGSQFGRAVAVPLAAVTDLERIEGVSAVVPRIVGTIVLGKEHESGVLVGLPEDHFPPAITCIQGRLPKSGKRNELVIGSELARRLRLRIGDLIAPFYRNRQGERLCEVVGIFDADISLWQSHLVFTTFETATAIFDQPDLATDLLVYCRPGYQEQITREVQQKVRFTVAGLGTNVQPRVTSRADLEALLPGGLLHREGIFHLLFLLAFVVGILVVLVTAGTGLTGRRREIGILKATGWQTDEILLREAVESFLLCLLAASLSLLLAFAWLEWLNGYWIASIFLTGADIAPNFKLPYRLTPIPALLAFVLSFVVVSTGSLYPAWRAAIVPPFEAIRSGR